MFLRHCTASILCIGLIFVFLDFTFTTIPFEGVQPLGFVQGFFVERNDWRVPTCIVLSMTSRIFYYLICISYLKNRPDITRSIEFKIGTIFAILFIFFSGMAPFVFLKTTSVDGLIASAFTNGMMSFMHIVYHLGYFMPAYDDDEYEERYIERPEAYRKITDGPPAYNDIV